MGKRSKKGVLKGRSLRTKSLAAGVVVGLAVQALPALTFTSYASTVPIVANESVSLNENSSKTIDLLSSDSDSNGGSLYVAGVGAPSHGSVSINSTNPQVKIMNAYNHPSMPTDLKITSSTQPVLVWNGMTFWAYSYIDNRVGMAIIEYDSSGNIVHRWDESGDRYISSIVVNEGAQTVTFRGQYYDGGLSSGITMSFFSLDSAPVVQTVTASSHPTMPSDLKTVYSQQPVLIWNGLTYWAYSYIDNRVGMAIIAYDSSGNIVKRWDESGDRYLTNIVVDQSAQKVTFEGQYQAAGLSNGIVMSYSDLYTAPTDTVTYTPQTGYVGPDSFTYTVTDSSGASATGSVDVSVLDTVPPVTTDNAPLGWSNKDVTVTLTPTDSVDGVAATYYELDGGNQQQGTTVQVTGDGTHSLTYWSVDNSGNVERPHATAVKIDQTAPVTTATVNPAQPDGQNGWYVHPASVTLAASDATSGVALTQYSLDGGSTWNTYSGPISITTDGTHSVLYRSKDNAGNVESAHTLNVNLDGTAPVTTDNAPSGWSNKDVIVTLTPTDSVDAVAATYYELDGGNQQQGTTVQVTGDGTHSLTYWSVDNSGNVERPHTTAVKIDQTAPVTTAATTPAQPDGQNGWYQHPVTVTLAASDAESGVASTKYSLDGGTTWIAYTAPISLAQDGKYTVLYRSTDNVGNVESAHTLNVNLDQTAPVTTSTVTPAQPDGQNGWYQHQISIALTASDAGSGVASTQYSLNGGTSWTTYSAPISLAQDGKYTVLYRSTDNAGNVESTHTLTFNVDQTAPNIVISTPTATSYSDADTLTPTYSVTDNLSGVNASSTVATLDGQTLQPNTTVALYTLPLGSHTFTVTSSDMAGNVSTQTVAFTTTTSSATLSNLVQVFLNNGMITDSGIATSLQSMVNNPTAFSNHVNAQSGKHISTTAAQYLLRNAQAIANSTSSTPGKK